MQFGDDARLKFSHTSNLSKRPGYASGRPCSSTDLLCISEVGVATSDVLATAALLNREADVRPYIGEPGLSFAPVGDTDGLLILVSPGRPWFPTTDRGASPGPILVEATGPRPGDYPLGVGSLLRIR